MIDSHCHLADAVFAPDLEAVITRARAAHVTSVLCILAACDADETARGRRVAALLPEARFSVGVHPHQARDFATRLDEVARTVRHQTGLTTGAAAIGEIGLDYHYGFSPRPVQREVFAAQIRLAREMGWPVVVHTREADLDTVALLREEGGGAVAGVFHCFSGDTALARQALDLGFFLSMSGILTFPKAAELRAVAEWAPLDRLLVETDCPYLAPVPLRGRRNEPAWVSYVIEALAQVRRTPAIEVEEAVTQNFTGLFGPSR